MEVPPPADQPAADLAKADQQPDDDAALALQLHREWNAPQKRVRHEERKPVRRPSDDDSSTDSSSSEDDDEDEGPAVGGETHRKKPDKKRKKTDRARRRREKKRAAGAQPWDTSRLGRDLQLHEQAAVAAVQKAARPFRARAAPPPYFKCFAVGVPWGALLPREALCSPFALADAAGAAFSRDGFECDVNRMSVTMVTSGKEVASFPAGESGEVERWTATAPRAARVYIENAST